MNIQGKYELELNFVDDRLFLNYWNSFNGNDVVVEIKDRILFLQQPDESEIAISFSVFLEMVKQSIKTVPA